jgi:hypothetical protein
MSVQLHRPRTPETPRPAPPPLQIAPELQRSTATLGALPLILGFISGAATACFVLSFFVRFS